MKRVEPQAEKFEFFGVNLSEVGKRGGQFTPVSSLWRRRDYSTAAMHGGIVGEKLAGTDSKGGAFMASRVSARKLAAALWELNQYKRPLRRMEYGGGDHLLRRRKSGLHPSSPSKLRQPFTVARRSGRSLSGENTHPMQVPAPSSHHSSIKDEVKELKKELHKAHSQLKSLLREQQADQQEIDELRKQMRRNKHQSLELVKHSEDFKRRLSVEADDVESALRAVFKELEEERCSKELLEELCDAFALEIRNYDKEMRFLGRKSDTNWRGRSDLDQLLHVAESWLEKRMQIKSSIDRRSNSAVDKLRREIEALIENRRIGSTGAMPTNREPTFRSEMAAAGSIPPDEGNEDDAPHSDSNLFELGKMSHDSLKSRTVGHSEATNQKGSKNPANLPTESTSQVNFKSSEHDERLHSDEHFKDHKKGKHQSSMMISEDSNGTSVDPMKGRHFLREVRNGKHHHVASVSSIWRTQPSPVRRWAGKLPSHGHGALKSSSRLPPDLKENSLEATLPEARSKSTGSKSRTKAS